MIYLSRNCSNNITDTRLGKEIFVNNSLPQFYIIVTMTDSL